MTFWGYVKNRWFTLLAGVGFIGLTQLLIWLIPGLDLGWDNIGYLVFLQVFFFVVFLIFDYFRKRPFYKRLQENQQSHLQDYVTEAKTGEQQLAANFMNAQIREHQELMQKLIQTTQEQKEYIDSWVHEIKVPLAALDLIIQSIEFDVGDKEYMLLNNEWQKIDEYVDQVMYYSRMDNFSRDYLIQEHSLKGIIQPVIKSQSNYFIQKYLRLEMVGEDSTILSDSKWVGFIFRQLLSNAIKYTPESGTIKVEISNEATGVTLKLIDTGMGIPAEDLGRIFEKGYTGKNGRLASQHATGLGLYLAKNLAEKLGITLTAKSKVGIGTEMTLFFPTLKYY